MAKLKLFKRKKLTELERHVLKYDSVNDALVALMDEWMGWIMSSLEMINTGGTKGFQDRADKEEILLKNIQELIANSDDYKSLLEAKHED